MYKYLKSHSVQNGVVRRVYESDYVKLMCNTKEILADEPDHDVRWNCTFLHSGKIEEGAFSWNKMADMFDEITTEKRLGQKELFA
jgi:hypothetical protein